MSPLLQVAKELEDNEPALMLASCEEDVGTKAHRDLQAGGHVKSILFKDAATEQSALQAKIHRAEIGHLHSGLAACLLTLAYSGPGALLDGFELLDRDQLRQASKNSHVSC